MVISERVMVIGICGLTTSEGYKSLFADDYLRKVCSIKDKGRIQSESVYRCGNGTKDCPKTVTEDKSG